MEEVRLQKYLAANGVASRRKAEEMILQGKVSVNGKVVTELGTKIISGKDSVTVDGKPVEETTEKVYILLNKPIGYVTTLEEQFGRDKVTDLLKGVKTRVLPVGRLDMYTSGALILTNDGDFIYQVTHPSHEVNKTYVATVKGIVTKEEIETLQNGVQIEDYTTAKAKVRILKTDEEKNQSRIEITIHEGRNRQVRKMCEAIGRKVLALHRSRIGEITVKELPLGTWRYLRQNEVKKLLNAKR